MRNTGKFLTCALISLTGALSLPAVMGTSIAQADTITPLPGLTNFHQMVLDSAKGLIFISEGESSNSTLQGYPSTSPLIVTDLTGKYVTTLDSGDGVDGLALSPDGGTLYAALAGDSAVAAIQVSSITASTSTPAQVLYPLPTGDIPYSVALQSGKVWVSYQPANVTNAGVAAIGDIDLSASDLASAFEAAPATVVGATGWYSPPDLAADPSDSGLLVAANPGSSLTSAATFSTTTSPETGLAAGSLGGTYTSATCGFENQITVIPGGASFIAACESPRGPEIFSPSDLATPTATYADDKTGPVAVAVSPTGLIATGDAWTSTVTSGTIPANAYVYSSAGTLYNAVPVATSSYGQMGGLAGWGALAWSADGSALYAATATQVLDGITNPITYSLQVITSPTLTRATVALSAPASVGVTRAVALSGKVTLSNGTVPPAGTQITITRHLGTATATFTVTTKSDGTFALTDTTAGNAGGTYTYTASYPGSATTAAATGSATVTIVKFASGLSMTLSATTINYGTYTVVTAHLAKTYTNHAVYVYAQQAGHARQLIGHGNVNSKGNFAVRYRSPYNVTYSATYAGDTRVAAAAVSHGVRVRAEVLESISGYNGTSGSYRLYTGSETLTAHVSVAPNKHGQCGRLEIDQYYQGAWVQIGLSPCFGLSSSSTLVVGVKLSGLANTAGIKFRIRGDYVASSTEKLNLGNDSGWQYFMVS